MANTTDAKLIVFGANDGEGVVEVMRKAADVNFVEDEGEGVLFRCALSSYSESLRCIGDDRLKAMIDAFQSYPFEDPEYAILVVCDDNSEKYDGTFSPN